MLAGYVSWPVIDGHLDTLFHHSWSWSILVNCDTLYINMKYTSAFCTLLVTFSCWSRDGTALYQDAPHLNLPKNSFFYRLRVEYIEIIRSSRERSAPLPRSYPATVIPKNFDARERWPQCESLRNVANQGLCGSCWVSSHLILRQFPQRILGFVYVAVDDGSIVHRFQRNRQLPLFSRRVADMLPLLQRTTWLPHHLRKRRQCCQSANPLGAKWSCFRGKFPIGRSETFFWIVLSLADVGRFQGCKPYSKQSFKQGKISSCEKICTNSKYTVSYDHDKRYGEEVNFATDIEQIQLEIMTNGPVLTVINVTLDLVNFRGDGEWTNCTFPFWIFICRSLSTPYTSVIQRGTTPCC